MFGGGETRYETMGEYTDLMSFDFQDHKPYDLENNIDPEIHFYQNIDLNCDYYSEDRFNAEVNMEGFSVIHFNSRSLYSNFSKIKHYLQQFKNRFSVIAISETWLRNDNEFQGVLDGYEMFWQNRVNKMEGGVALLQQN